ncbi:unnamed protein product, partial [Ectocarpus sp. 12 AP-2014]
CLRTAGNRADRRKGKGLLFRCSNDPADTARTRQRQQRLSCSTWRTERINLIQVWCLSRRGVDEGHSTEDGGSREEDALGHEDRRAQAGGEGDHHGQEAQDLRRRQAEEEQVAKGERGEGGEEEGGGRRSSQDLRAVRAVFRRRGARRREDFS